MDTLRIKDILHYATDYDPLVTTTPYNFPRSQNSPIPFIKTFSFNEFRAFWTQERKAFQWLHRSEGNARFYEQKPLDLEAPLPVFERKNGQRGRPREFDWSVKHVCRHADAGKSPSASRDSVRQDCPVFVRIQKPFLQDQLEVIYFWRHNHNTSPASRMALTLGSNDRNWTKEKVQQGFGWKMMKQLLTPSPGTLHLIEQGQENLPPGLRISYAHVRNRIYRQRQKASRKHQNVVQSVQLWLKQIEEAEGKVQFWDKIDGDPQHFMIAWSSAFQLKIMAGNKLIACMDSTHKVVKGLRPSKEKTATTPAAHRSAYLYTILVKDHEIQRGVPIAFMITHSESKYRLVQWLTWLKYTCGFTTEKFMIDCAVTEIEAIKAVFPRASIYHCLFHVGQLWEKHLRAVKNAKDSDEMRPLLNTIRRAKSKDELYSLWNDFAQTYKGHKGLINYIQKNWICDTKLATWVAFERENYQHMDTNNLVESWHKTLKKCHLGNERNVRADFLMYLLHEVINSDLRVKHLKIKAGILRPELSSYDKVRKAASMNLDLADAVTMVTEELVNEKFEVRSFASPGVKYSIAVNPQKLLLLSCSCADFEKHQIPCKHLYLAQRVYNHFAINYDSALIPTPTSDEMDTAQEEGTDDFGLRVEDVISPQLALQLQESRAREEVAKVQEEDRKKRAREVAIAEEFEECEQELNDLWVELGKVISPLESAKKRRCTLEYMQNAVAHLKAATRDVKGINVVGAGRTCNK